MQKLQERQERKKNKKHTTASEAGEPVVEKIVPLTTGDIVKIKGQTTSGEILEVNGKNAVVLFGSIKTTIKLERLERTQTPAKQPALIVKSTFVGSQTQDEIYEKRLHFKQDIDVRGMRGDEALQAVTYFIDDALLVGVSRVRILHGTGTGALRTLIRQYLGTVSGVRHFADEHVQFGGAGITVVDF
jgi:DNA mismatch repair protein MutS2